MKLRPYQQRAVRTSIGHLRSGRSSVLVSPTGSGKTVMGVAIVADFANPTEGRRVLWLAHREELIQQARDRLIADLGDPIGIISGRRTESADAAIVVASIDSLRRREVERFDLVVVDEAHRTPAASYRKVLKALEGVPALGLTATPWRLDRKGLGDLYSEMIVAAQPSQLFAEGHQIRPRVYGPDADHASELTKDLKLQAGDFNQAEASARMIRISGDVVALHRELAGGMRTIVFAVDRRHGQELAGRFAASGLATAYLDGETPASERDGIIRRLRSGETTVVVNVDVLTEGVDLPEVQCVSIARPTKSLTRYLQYCGRAMRPFEGQQAVILDHTGNAYRLNVPYVDREWSLADRPSQGGVAPLARKCGHCGEVIEAHLLVCPCCSAELGPREKTIEEREHERLVELRTRKCADCEGKFVAGYVSDPRLRCPACIAKRKAESKALRLRECECCNEDFIVVHESISTIRCPACIAKRKAESKALRLQACKGCGEVFDQRPSDHAAGRRCLACIEDEKSKVAFPLGSGLSTAERLKRRSELKRAAGICLDCLKPAASGKLMCEEHLAKRRERYRAIRTNKRQTSEAAE